jgi:hypothetical protein
MSPLVAFCITEALQYGPEFVKSVIAAFQKPNPTVMDIEILFAGVKPYSAYNIPDVNPAAPVPTVAPAVAPVLG